MAIKIAIKADATPAKAADALIAKLGGGLETSSYEMLDHDFVDKLNLEEWIDREGKPAGFKIKGSKETVFCRLPMGQAFDSKKKYDIYVFKGTRPVYVHEGKISNEPLFKGQEPTRKPDPKLGFWVSYRGVLRGAQFDKDKYPKRV